MESSENSRIYILLQWKGVRESQRITFLVLLLPVSLINHTNKPSQTLEQGIRFCFLGSGAVEKTLTCVKTITIISNFAEILQTLTRVIADFMSI